MSFAASRGTANRKQIGKIRHLASELGEGETLVLALARDARVASMRTDPRLLGHPITDDLTDLSMFEASSIIRTLEQGIEDRGTAPVIELKPEPPRVITLAEIMAEARGPRAADGDPLGAELRIWGL